VNTVTKSRVIELASEAGIDLVGFATATPDAEAAGRMRKCISEGRIPEGTGFQIKDPDGFCDPQTVLPGAASVICIAQSYFTDEPEDLSKPGEPHGLVARYTWRNHYAALRERLVKLATAIGEEGGGDAMTECISNGAIAEKPLAQRAGLGHYGRHGIIITKEFGSRVVLGEIVTELEFESDPPCTESCGPCGACMKACPTGALVEPMVLDRAKCLQQITSSAKPMPREYRELWGKRLYGCSTCQDVCPKNLKAKRTDRRPTHGYAGPSLPLMPLLSMPEKEYRSRYGGNQMAARWIAMEAILRNACVALGNTGDPVAVPALAGAMSHPSELVRSHAAWALGKIGGPSTKAALERLGISETSAEVKREIDWALEAHRQK
jgi:epoxyqueuosine reductase